MTWLWHFCRDVGGKQRMNCVSCVSKQDTYPCWNPRLQRPWGCESTRKRVPIPRCPDFLLSQPTETLFDPSELRLLQQTANNILKCSKRRRAWSMLRFKTNEQCAYLSEAILKESMRKYSCLIIKGWRMTLMSMKHKDYDTQSRI